MDLRISNGCLAEARPGRIIRHDYSSDPIMRIVSNAMLIVSGVYLALGLIYLRFWWAERVRMAYLAFTISCLSYMLFSWFELGMMKAGTPEEYLFNAWWAFFPGSVGLISFAWFAYLHLHGRKWLFVTYAALRILTMVLHSHHGKRHQFPSGNVRCGARTFWAKRFLIR